MLWLGQLANGTRSIYDVETQKEMACIHQKEEGDKILFRIEPKEFLSENHVEDYKKWLLMLDNYMKSNPLTRDKKISFIKIEDNDFEEAVRRLYSTLHLFTQIC